MDKLENLRFKLEYAVAKGYTYNELTGEITTPKNKVAVRVDNGYISISVPDMNGKNSNLKGVQLAWYIGKGEVVEKIEVINGIKTDMRIENLKAKPVNTINNNSDKQIASITEKSIGKYRTKLGTCDKKNTTSFFINVQARVTISNGMDIDANFRRFRARLNPWVYKHTNELFNGVKTSTIKSCEYADSNKSHSGKSRTVLNFELTLLFDKPIDFKKEFYKFENLSVELTEFFEDYDDFKIEGSIK